MAQTRNSGPNSGPGFQVQVRFLSSEADRGHDESKQQRKRPGARNPSVERRNRYKMWHISERHGQILEPMQNMAHTRMSGPNSGVGFQATILITFQVAWKRTAGMTNAKSSAKAVAHGIPASNPGTDVKCGTYKKVTASFWDRCRICMNVRTGFWPWLQGKRPENHSRCSEADRGHGECKKQREGRRARNACVEPLVDALVFSVECLVLSV